MDYCTIVPFLDTIGGMPRISLNSSRAKLLIEKTIQLFLAAGSTAALAKMLNSELREKGEEMSLHPNRLHSLLSEDPSRGLNERTFDLIEQAADSLSKDPRTKVKALEAATRLRSDALDLLKFGGVNLEEVAGRLAIPQAVLNELLPNAVPVSPPQEETKAVNKPKSPDWSFQDIAVARCLDAIGARPAPRVGLILPTGAGKTRTALRIALFVLKSSPNGGRVLWITHRRNLRAQAHRELQKLLTSPGAQVPDGAVALLAERLDFVMLSEVSSHLEPAATAPALVIIDEAHHAAAASYASVLESEKSFPVLLLTATPNRTDGLPIGIDEIAYTITYRELAERGAILRPKFLDFPVTDFDWSRDAVQDLADYVVERSAQEFTKVLVLAPRVDRVEEFYEALRVRLANESDHPLDLDDLGYIHGARNSLGIDNEDFLARFATKPRAIVISAQLLLEGFDDPSVNTVIITYPTSSVIRLMQAAGRCVRYSPSKTSAYVVQARNDQIAYHFDHRWLYQEIDDFLRPELIDIDYGANRELNAEILAMLTKHNVNSATCQAILNNVHNLRVGDTCRLLLFGLPYYGALENFSKDATWGAFLEEPSNSETFRSIFNTFCSIGADVSDPSDFLLRDGVKHGLVKNLQADSDWMRYVALLTACYLAKREIHGPGFTEGWGRRPLQPHGHTTWLKYITFTYRPTVPPELVDFFADCHNAAQVQAEYVEHRALYRGAVKIPLILGGSEAFLLSEQQFHSLAEFLSQLREEILRVPPADQYAVFAAALVRLTVPTLPNRLLCRVESLLGDASRCFDFKSLLATSIGDVA
ncbi:putative helicase, ATP-dependent [Acidobacterium capsulatum ATCC 51196]|uniref:Putative helicase, ATP-dependent n=1 Tax=Acidobacterium capsulatum (strain ATCC 51196 / DSM 11244 / BCRC 80197 / JCM 7670 / NBRC 15755 / NCIMB 13165 / 161) TaxID=240015 RepID=C1F5K9_ACIC5|nr:putative helicase, ATP-dependent [Acidobacterium capsulatum ATCC 51196]